MSRCIEDEVRHVCDEVPEKQRSFPAVDAALVEKDRQAGDRDGDHDRNIEAQHGL